MRPLSVDWFCLCCRLIFSLRRFDPLGSTRSVSVFRSGRLPACRRVGHPARRIVPRPYAVSSVFRAAIPGGIRCRPLRQPRWLPLQLQADAKHIPRSNAGSRLGAPWELPDQERV